MKWDQLHEGYFEAPGGYSVERRAGHWMTFVPDEDEAIYVSPHSGHGVMAFDWSDEAKKVAEKHAQIKEKQ